MGWSVAMVADQHLLLLLLAKTVSASNAVRTPPAFLTCSNIPLVFVQTFVVEVFITLAAVEKLDTFKVGLILANLTSLGFAFLTDEKLGLQRYVFNIITFCHLKLSFSSS
jgi:hypothetical protein